MGMLKRRRRVNSLTYIYNDNNNDNSNNDNNDDSDNNDSDNHKKEKRGDYKAVCPLLFFLFGPFSMNENACRDEYEYLCINIYIFMCVCVYVHVCTMNVKICIYLLCVLLGRAVVIHGIGAVHLYMYKHRAYTYIHTYIHRLCTVRYVK